MHLTNSRSRDHITHVVLADSAAGDDGDSIPRLIHKSRDDFRALERGRCTSGREDAGHAEIDELLKRVRHVDRGVERAVERDGQPASCFDQSACLLNFYSAIGSERAGYDSCDADVRSCLDVASHQVDLVVSVDEVASTRTNQYEYGELRPVDYGGRQSRAWRSAAIVEVYTELDAVGTGPLGGES